MLGVNKKVKTSHGMAYNLFSFLQVQHHCPLPAFIALFTWLKVLFVGLLIYCERKTLIIG
jgi:hypothetical protein